MSARWLFARLPASLRVYMLVIPLTAVCGVHDCTFACLLSAVCNFLHVWFPAVWGLHICFPAAVDVQTADSRELKQTCFSLSVCPLFAVGLSASLLPVSLLFCCLIVCFSTVRCLHICRSFPLLVCVSGSCLKVCMSACSLSVCLFPGGNSHIKVTGMLHHFYTGVPPPPKSVVCTSASMQSAFCFPAVCLTAFLSGCLFVCYLHVCFSACLSVSGVHVCMFAVCCLYSRFSYSLFVCISAFQLSVCLFVFCMSASLLSEWLYVQLINFILEQRFTIPEFCLPLI